VRLGSAALVPATVLAGHLRHDLLRVSRLDVADEALGSAASKCRDDDVVALDDELSGSPLAIGEPEVLRLRHVFEGTRPRDASGTVDPMGDLGYFGPGSVSWQVHREVTVLFGGARAVLMQAAHPLVIAGARESGFYERNPWRRLQRTLVLTYTITFGTRAEAQAAAERINEVHARVSGVDEVTGLPYDGLDPELLLYVHACLVDSALLFEQLTVGRLDEAGRQRFHEEQMLAAELLLVPRASIPPTVAELRAHLQRVFDSGITHVGDAARKVAALFHDPPREAEWRPVLKGVSRLAFGTLPPELRTLYGVQVGGAHGIAMDATFAAIRALRPLLPARYRFIAPYQEWLLRRQGKPVTGSVDRARRSAGIRLDRSKSIPG